MERKTVVLRCPRASRSPDRRAELHGFRCAAYAGLWVASCAALMDGASRVPWGVVVTLAHAVVDRWRVSS